LHIVIAGIIIFGGLGFSPIMDVFSPRALRERLAMPWKDWKLNTKLAIYTAIVLIIFGMVIYYLLERKNTLAGLNMLEALITSFFQSVITRTAGFNTVDFTKLQNPYTHYDDVSDVYRRISRLYRWGYKNNYFPAHCCLSSVYHPGQKNYFYRQTHHSHGYCFLRRSQ
jgi:hypothetical protein